MLGFLGVLVLSLGAVLTRPEGSEVAMWWPAAALSAWMVLVVPRRRKPVAALVVAVAVAAGNGLNGRGLDVSVVFGLCNGLEALAAGLVLSGAPRPALKTVSDLGRLLVAVLSGAVVIAMTAGPAAWWLLDADPVRVGASVFASHGSALLLLLPFALSRTQAIGEAGMVERATQSALLALLVLITFGPGQDMPLSLVPVAALVWSAMRCSARFALVQNAVTAAVITAMTLSGWGPYADAAQRSDNPLVAINLVQLFSLVVTSVVVAVAVLTQERRQALGEVERLSTHDALTGMGNRRLLEDRVGFALHEAERGLRSTLLLLDLDGFKKVNDVDGHHTGDSVLVAVAQRLTHLLRPTDTLVRLGGDEFVVLLYGLSSSSEACAALRERLRAAVAEPYDGATRRIGASIGCTALNAGATLDELLHEADSGMYADKKHRRSGHLRSGVVPEPRHGRPPSPAAYGEQRGV